MSHKMFHRSPWDNHRERRDARAKQLSEEIRAAHPRMSEQLANSMAATLANQEEVRSRARGASYTPSTLTGV